LALVQEDPTIKTIADQMITSFVNDPPQKTTIDIGLLLSFVTITSSNWNDISTAVINKFLARYYLIYFN
jgi:hypothetical protein